MENKKLYCPHCGSENPTIAKHCIICGKKIIKETNLKSEIILTIIGTIFGFIMPLIILFVPTIHIETNTILTQIQIISALILMIIGLIGTIILPRNTKAGGILITLTAILLALNVATLEITTIILYTIAGIKTLIKA